MCWIVWLSGLAGSHFSFSLKEKWSAKQSVLT
jgi:hypothetical protein